jgi:hypothetical protein
MNRESIHLLWKRKNQGKVLFEIGLFFRRHQFLTLLSIFSWIILIKGIDAELVCNNAIMRFLFLIPIKEPGLSIFRILNDFSFAILSCELFYIVTQYVPQRRRELKAYRFVKSQLEDLFMMQGKLISIILYLINDKSVFPNIQLDVLSELGNLILENKLPV